MNSRVLTSQARIRRSPRLFPALAALLALTTGCHHREPAYNSNIYAPATTAAPARTVARHKPAPIEREPETTRGSRGAEPQSETSGEEKVHGKPVSTEVGLASWYGPPYHNRQAADGSIFDQNALTAAHRTLPMGSLVRVTDLATGESVVAKITDRGPFVPNRVLDLSLAAAKAIGLYRAGVDKVRVEAYAPANGVADPGGRWCVQIGVFIDPDDALQLKNDLKSRIPNAKVIEFAGPTGHWVRINPNAPDHATAEHIANSIHVPDADAYLVRLN